MPTPSITDIIAVVVSIFALFFSFYTFYVSQMKRFIGSVEPMPRISLTWIQTPDDESLPSIFIEYEFLNFGAKIGRIDDVMLEVENLASTDKIRFIAYAMKDEKVDMLQEGGDDLRLQDFSTIWLKPYDTQHASIFFMPIRLKNDFRFTAGGYQIRTLFSGDNTQKRQLKKAKITINHWKEARNRLEFSFYEEDLLRWSQDKDTIRIDDHKLIEKRRESGN